MENPEAQKVVVNDAATHPSGRREPSEAIEPKKTWAQRLFTTLKEPGSALQIVVAAAIAIIIGMSVSATVDEIPEAVPVLL